MAYTTETFDADDSGDWTVIDGTVSFASGYLERTPGAFGAAVVTTNFDWDFDSIDVHRMIFPFMREADGYYHRFMFSFDGGDNWNIFTAGAWVEELLANIGVYGMLRYEVEELRMWKQGTGRVRVAVWMNRTNQVPEPAGRLTSIAFEYLATSDDRERFLTQDEVGGLDADLEFMPSTIAYPLNFTATVPHAIMVSEKGYRTVQQLPMPPRETVPVKTIPMDRAQADGVVEFIRSQFGKPLKWKTPEQDDDDDPRYFKVTGSPQMKQLDVDVWEVSFPTMEVFRA